jgi:NAD(P)-dependent dehydrogenase (short-subunit alcohol dehydrogenase family)
MAGTGRLPIPLHGGVQEQMETIMTNAFGATSTTDDVLAGLDLRGKRVLVTGASAGLGIETCRALAAHGADVVGAARDLAKAEVATAAVRAAASASGGSFALVELDLASLASVRACADALNAQGQGFDVIITNAGVMAPPFGHTADGFETQFGTNHLGHFLLVNHIAGLIREGGRLVSLSSSGHRLADVDLEDPNFERSAYDPWVGYGRSKTANILFAVEFDARHRERGIRATAVHPGVIWETELSRHMSEDEKQALVGSIEAGLAAAGQPALTYKSIAQGAATSVWSAVVASADAVGGRYCEDCHVAHVEELEGIRAGVRPYALDRDRARALWTLSERLVGEQF